MASFLKSLHRGTPGLKFCPYLWHLILVNILTCFECESLCYDLQNFKCLMTNHATFDTQLHHVVASSCLHLDASDSNSKPVLFYSTFRPNNMIAQSQSGTGKTAAFVLSMLSRVDATKNFTQVLFIVVIQLNMISVSASRARYLC